MANEQKQIGQLTDSKCVRCKSCDSLIFIESPTRVTVLNGRRYLALTCPVETCERVFTYEEDELFSHLPERQ
jgi:RNase P subunit RPR2